MLATFKGGELEGCVYAHPLAARASPLVIGGDYITTDTGEAGRYRLGMDGRFAKRNE